MIRFEKVTKRYQDGNAAIKPLDLKINDGEFFVIIGPSGCGKTTLLKMMNRLIELTDGTIFVDDKKISDYNIHELRWNMGYVLQQIALFPHMTIAENIAVVPELKKWNNEKIRQRTDELMEMVGLPPEKYRGRKPKELSGGEQQRIGVIRALASNPGILLMDEPFSALDPISREKLQDDILELQRKINKTIVFVTHDMQEAIKLGDRICLMKDGEIVQVGTPKEIIENPVNDFVRDFVGTHSAAVKDNIRLEDIIEQLITSDSVATSSVTIPVSASLREALMLLTEHERLSVTKEGQIVGMITRQTALQYMAEGLQEVGIGNG
ncbi:ABC transporter ATP-binding protein [Neobacillus vireti]|uniref:Quaternary amine transport ATP-binding protein n=1 Tax=Neobacillus vireti LMG 21834 TaxID=1131730 RepID=A0AB94IQ11_9BACI|nr:ABC transporter ATP-binding protein [Neobacillus vireti]ETI69102.1 glycine betaine/carnitine/choline transport ATP-binding protein [Neobacillus vireti LMG 21834]KLT15632.1 glycine/betaine ABC transporter ATP-binding protein [Neobacillus vireti]